MKFFIITKYKILSFTFCLITGILTLVLATQGVSTAISVSSNNNRQIPIYCVEKQEKIISISFDAAWGNEQTTELLDILEKYNVKTTFFVVGEWVDKYPDSVKEIHDRGHEVCNHSNTHPYMTKLSKEDMKKQIQDCNNKIAAITGETPILFRPPYGDYDNTVVETVKELGMYCIQWDVDSLDWKDPTVDQMKSRVCSKIKEGSIVLFHNGAKNTPAALPVCIESIQSEGYQIVPISQLIHQGSYQTDHEGRQKACN